MITGPEQPLRSAFPKAQQESPLAYIGDLLRAAEDYACRAQSLITAALRLLEPQGPEED